MAGNEAVAIFVADLRRLAIQLPTIAIVAAACGTLIALATDVPYNYPTADVSAVLTVLVAIVVVSGRIAAALLRESATKGLGADATSSTRGAVLPLAWVVMLMLLCGWAAIVLAASAIAYSPRALNTSWAYELALRNLGRVGVATVCCVVFAVQYVGALLAWQHRSQVIIELGQLVRRIEHELHRLASDIIGTDRREP